MNLQHTWPSFKLKCKVPCPTQANSGLALVDQAERDSARLAVAAEETDVQQEGATETSAPQSSCGQQAAGPIAELRREVYLVQLPKGLSASKGNHTRPLCTKWNLGQIS